MQALLKEVEKVLPRIYRYDKVTDRVAYMARKPGGGVVQKWGTGIACYARVLREDIGRLDISCLPSNQGQSGLPGMWYRTFFYLAKQAGLVPPEVQVASIGGSNCLFFPGGKWDRHTAYITLCLYRHSDIRPIEIARCLALWRRLSPQGTTFLQCLHYMLLQTSIGTGHCFLSAGPYGATHARSLATGQALAHFGKLPPEERHKLVQRPGRCDSYSARAANYTSEMFGKLAKTFPYREPVVSDTRILDPKHGELYQDPKPEVKSAQASPEGKPIRVRKGR